ncbi:hypothetical protein Hanom_Chr14g01262651 [Helianthus anomalus]
MWFALFSDCLASGSSASCLTKHKKKLITRIEIDLGQSDGNFNPLMIEWLFSFLY